MSNIDARRPVFRLHEKSLTNHCSAHFLVRVPIEHEVDSRHFARDSLSDILARHAGRDAIVARRLVEAGVNCNENYVRAGASDLMDALSHCRHDVTEAQASANICGSPDGDAGRGRTDDSNLQARPFDDSPWTIGMDPLRIDAVCVCG